MAETNEAQILEELIIANGLNASTGEYLTPPMKVKDLVGYILQEETPADYDRLEYKDSQKEEAHFAPVYGVKAKEISSTGWGVIYGPGISDAVKEALSPLINLRQTEAERVDALFQEHTYQPGESCGDFLNRLDVGLGAAEPTELPYYLLIVGGPEEIPFNFQYELDVDRAVGRIYFDTLEEYDNYARSVVAAEKGEVRLPNRASFFSAANPDDTATQLSTDMLLEPMFGEFKTKLAEKEVKWDVRSYFREAATKAALTNLLGGSEAETPAFLLTGSHGVGFSRRDPKQLAHQGALVCQDWDGNPANISEDVYFAGEHLASDARLHGLISFFFACYGAGTPDHDEFMRKVEGRPKPIAPKAFVAGLPRRMLSHPRGGALAVIGHIERAWTHSFKWSGKSSAHLGHFESTLGRLFDGYPVGYAFDYINERHASASVQLVGLLDRKRRRLTVKDIDLIQTWSVNNDARDYIILGDPAVRLCAPETKKEAVKPSTLQLKEVDLTGYKPGAVPPDQPGADSSEEAEEPATTKEAMSAVADDAESMALISEDQKAQLTAALKNITQRLARTLNDLGTLEVRTYLSDDDLENVYDPESNKFNEQAKLKALTRISLDGDIEIVVPSRKVETLTEDNQLTARVELDEELWKIHRDMVELAQANRTTFFKNLAEVAVTLMNTRLG